MPATTNYSLTGNPYIDGVLGDLKWAVRDFSFSFPTDGSFYGADYGYGEPTNNFGSFNATQQAATRVAFSMFSSVSNLTFTEITETATRHAELRFAMSDAPSTAWAYFPSTAAEGGDAWFNKSSGYYSNPVKGGYAYSTLLHEIGHTLGLEHTHEANIMPLDRDSKEYSVMSYRSYIGASTSGGYTNEKWGYPQSLMMYDIAAIQHMYGADYTTNGGNSRYSWSPTTGEMSVNSVGQGAPGGNRIFLTVWDGGGVDTYDFSSYTTDLKVDLRPGEWTTTASSQLAKLHYDGSKIAVGNIANALLHNGDTRSLIENAIGGAGNDTIIGNKASNLLRGGGGNDVFIGASGMDSIQGGIGSDIVVYERPSTDYGFIAQNGRTLVGRSDMGLHSIIEVEVFQFAEGKRSASSPLEYTASYADLRAALGIDAAAAFEHFSNYGWQEGRVVVFDGLEYIASYADLIAAFGADPNAGAKHFIYYGTQEGRCAAFDSLEYIASYGDLVTAYGANSDAGATHFISYGAREGRRTTFDSLEYIASYGDLITAYAANSDAGATHFISYGAREGRRTTFDSLEYIASYGDLITAYGANSDAGAIHFISYGAREGRRTTFDSLEYIASYGDLITAYGANSDAGATHFISYGAREGRPIDLFDEDQYLENYADLRTAFADGNGGYDKTAAVLHFIQHGFSEGRTDDWLVA
jgi:Ca2+-binding RTX toxin-like protein